MDTVYVLKTDTIMLTKDSLITKVNLRLDTAKVDSLILELIGLKANGEPEKIRAVERLIYKEIIPDLTYTNKDSLKIMVDDKPQWVRFDVNISIREDSLTVITKPTGDITYVSEKAVVSIDARKMGRWWKGFQWGMLAMLIIVVALWFFRGAIGAAINRF